MKPPKIASGIVVVLIIAVGVWWFKKSTPTVMVASKKTVVVSNPEVLSSKPPTPSAQVAAPVAAPATKSAQTVVTATQTTTSAGNVQADLKTAIPDIVRLLRAGSLVTWAQTYSLPGELSRGALRDLQWLQDVRNPRFAEWQKRIEATANAFESLVGQTPVFNTFGDKATYTFPTPPDHAIMGTDNTSPSTIVFIKQNGKWYMELPPE